MDYVNIDIRVAPDPGEENYYLVTASTTGRTAQGRFYFSAETWQSVEPSLVALGARETAGMTTRDQVQQVRDFGKQLFNCLINGEVRSLYDYKRQDAVKNPKILRLRLTLVPSDLVVLPWEILFDERYLNYLCLTKRPKTVLMRSIDSVTHRRSTAKYNPPLRILGMIADPTDLPSLQSQSERKIIEEALQRLVEEERVYLEWKPGRASELEDLPYSSERWDVFHFIGHGRFEEPSQQERGQGQLAFENEHDRSRAIYIPTQHFCESLPRATKLVVLNACETGRGHRFNRLSNIAYSLATQKIPAVVAMQFKILDTASNSFSETFYKLLAKGTPVDEAVAEARREIHKMAADKDRLDWAAPILYVSSSRAFSFHTDPTSQRKRTSPTPVLDIPSPVVMQPLDSREKTSTLPSVPESVVDAPIPTLDAPLSTVTQPLDPGEKTSTLSSEPEVAVNSIPSLLGGQPPINLPSPSNTGETTVVLPSESGVVVDLSSGTEDASQGDHESPSTRQSRLLSPLPPSIYKVPRRVYIPVASIIIFILVVGGVLVLPSLLSKSSPDLFPALCSGNFQSANVGMVPTPNPGTSSDGGQIGLSEGKNIFDLQRPNLSEVQDKVQAAKDMTNNPQAVKSLLRNAISADPTDVEAQIYLEDWTVLGSNHPHITLVVGVNFTPSSAGASRSILQGAFTAQKECNDHNRQDASKTQIVLMVANIRGNNPDDRAKSGIFVADQIADQAVKDPAIVAVMGWPSSTDSINVNHQLKFRGSHLPMVSPSASSEDLADVSNFFRVCPTNREQAQMAADFLLKKKQKIEIAILYDSTTSYAITLKNDIAGDNGYIPKVNIVGPVSYVGGDSKTLQDALNTLLAQSPDAIFFAGQVTDLAVLLNAISSIPQAKNLLIVGGDTFAITNAYPNPLPDLHNVYFTAFASPNEWDGTNQTPPFFRDYQSNFGTPPASTGLPSVDADVMLGYDATFTLLYASQQVLSKQNTIAPSDVTQALKQIKGTNAIQGVTGRIAFKDNGDQQSKRVILEHIEGTSLKVYDSQGCFRVTDNCGP